MALNTLTANATSLADALQHLTATIQAALTQYEQGPPQPAMEFSCRKWRGTALQLLRADLQRLNEALVASESPASMETYVDVGGNEVGLAKKLDAFRFDFAGPDFERRLNDEVSATVVAASALVRSIASLKAR